MTRMDLDLNDDDRAALADAADEAGLDVKEYVRSRALRAARVELRPRLPDALWMQCTDGCGDVFLDTEGKYDSPHEPAPCCGTASVRMLWPEKGIGLFEVAEMDLEDSTHLRAAAIFTCATLEAMMGEILVNALLAYHAHPDIAELVLHRAQSRGALLGTYKAIARTSASAVLQSAGMGSWFTDWTGLVDARNKFAHGEWYVAREGELEALVQRVYRNARQAMAALHNGIMVSVRRRTLNPKPFARRSRAMGP